MTVCLLEVSSWSVCLDQTTSLFLNSAWERELDLAVVHLLDQRTATLASLHGLAPDDLDAVGTGSVSGSHVPD